MSVYDRIPRSALDADGALGERGWVALDTQTRLVREPDGSGVSLLYRWRTLVRWSPGGDILLSSSNCSRVALRRIAAALPDEWTIEFRPRRRRARFLYRGTYPLEVGTTFVLRADGGVQWGAREVAEYDILTRAMLDREVSEMQGFTPLASRRRRTPPPRVSVDFPELPLMRYPRNPRQRASLGPRQARLNQQAMDWLNATERASVERMRQRAYANLMTYEDEPTPGRVYDFGDLCDTCGRRYGEHYGDESAATCINGSTASVFTHMDAEVPAPAPVLTDVDITQMVDAMVGPDIGSPEFLRRSRSPFVWTTVQAASRTNYDADFPDEVVGDFTEED